MNNFLQIINCGFPGSVHDGRVFRNSGIWHVKMQTKRMCSFQMELFLLGDAAYPCIDWFVTPFKDNGNLSQEKSFNSIHHSQTRVHIERAFGLSKDRFRKLKCMNINNVANINQIVTACA